MKVLTKEERCSEPRVADYTGYHFGRCSRRGTMSEEGKLWCFQHAPSSIKARRAKSAAKWKADQDRRNAPYDEAKRLRAVNAKLLGALNALLPLRVSHQRDGWAANFDRAREAIEEARK